MLKKRKVSIIGATGSVGSAAYNVIKQNPNLFEVNVLAAKSNYKKLVSYALELKAKTVIIEEDIYYKDLCKELRGHDINIISGKKSIVDFLQRDNEEETVLISSSGYDSIPYFYGALRNIKNIAMANKESIVCGGDFSKLAMKNSQAQVIPVDSEHSALFQSMSNEKKADISSIVITASGGSFVDYSLEDLKQVTKEQALKHPTWNMGKKITIDSSTLVNKALEVIEASYLFDLHHEKIEVLIHRQSILHGGVNYKDGSFIGHFSYPSMEIPVAYGLFYPHRIPTSIKSLSLSDLGILKFEKLDENRFRAIKIARDVLDLSKNYPCVFNVANEVAVESFLNDKISFHNIIDVLEYTLNKAKPVDIYSEENIMEEVMLSKEIALNYIRKLSK